jgi:hypothetical protein
VEIFLKKRRKQSRIHATDRITHFWGNFKGKRAKIKHFGTDQRQQGEEGEAGWQLNLKTTIFERNKMEWNARLGSPSKSD